jgi:hypothetical protein
MRAFEHVLASAPLSTADAAAFAALSPTRKAQFVTAALTRDPQTVPGVQTTVTTNTTTVPAAKVVPTGARVTAGTAAAVYDVTTRSRFNSVLFGVTIGYWYQEFHYQTGNNRVLNVQSCAGTWTGWSGFWSVSKSDSMWLASGQGHCLTTFTGHLVYKGSSVSMNKQMGLVVNGAGIVNRWLVNI